MENLERGSNARWASSKKAKNTCACQDNGLKSIRGAHPLTEKSNHHDSMKQTLTSWSKVDTAIDSPCRIARLVSCLFLLVSLQTIAQSLDETWQVQIGGQTVQVQADGSFRIPNVRIEPQSALIQTNPNAPTLPHYARVIGFKADGQTLRYVYSPPIEIQSGATIEISPDQLTFSDSLPIMVTKLALSAGRTQLPGASETTQLQLQATYTDGSAADVTLANQQTVYQSSNAGIASISADGLVTAHSAGTIYVSAIHEGLTASRVIQVSSPSVPRTLIGFVYGPSGGPIPNAVVHIPGTKLATSTGTNGRFVFSNLPASLGTPKVRIVTGAGDRHFGQTLTLDTTFTTIDGGILTGRTSADILTLPCTDPDQDCLPDEVELLLGLDPNDSDTNNNGTPDGLEDHDADQLVNRLEVFLGTNPQLADTDSDGLSDGAEVLQYGSIPSLNDSDGNGTLDGAQDQDNDGLLDVAEDINGNYLVDENESSPFKTDTDGDSVIDPQELLDQTSPSNEFDFEPRALSEFSFDSALYLGNQNQVPLVNVGSSLVTSFGPTGRNGYNASAGNRLVYRVVEANNHANINLLRGTIKFWFKPNWNSGDVGHAFGSRLLEIGQFSSTGVESNGWWGLFLNSNRTKITFASQGPNSPFWERYIEAPDLNFQAGQWYEIELAYGPRTTYTYGRKDPLKEQRYSNSYLYINGQREGSGFGVDPNQLPNETAISGGFVLGSQHNGTLPASAIFDELRTYNYPLHTWNDRILTDRNWAATTSANAITLERRFPRSPILPIPVDIFRRVSGSEDWGQPIATNYAFPLYRDQAVLPGLAYEYRIWDTTSFDFSGLNRLVLQQHLTAAIDLPPVHDRGKVIMMIESTISAPLATEITQFKSDLVGDGWQFSSLLVSRQNDDDLELNKNAVKLIKSLINLEIEPNRTNVVIMLGHVPVPMAGFTASDGHDNQPQNRPDHRGAWTADGYYGSTNKNYWTDVGPTVINNLDSPQNSNLPDDGKFDQDTLPQPFGIAVGRIDFARMTAFINAPYLPGFPNHDSRSVEIELLRQYLNKNNRYRHGTLTFESRMAGFRGFGQNRDTATGFYNAQNLSAALYGLDEKHFINMRGIPQRVSYGFGFNEMNSFNSGTQLGWEHLNASNSYNHRTSDFTDLENEPRIAFQLYYGSYFGDWNLKVDNWLKALLCTPNSGLAAIYYYPNKWRLEKMGLGAPIAVGMQEFNDLSKYTNYGVLPNGTILPFYHPVLAPPRMLSILGDPTLRAHILPPPHSPSATVQARRVTLTWQAPPNTAGLQYHIYRSSNGIEGDFIHLTSISPVSGNTWTDTVAPLGQKLYSIRAAKPQITGSGSYINLSQAAFITVE